jgi:hypothetical protein
MDISLDQFLNFVIESYFIIEIGMIDNSMSAAINNNITHEKNPANIAKLSS